MPDYVQRAAEKLKAMGLSTAEIERRLREQFGNVTTGRPDYVGRAVEGLLRNQVPDALRDAFVSPAVPPAPTPQPLTGHHPRNSSYVPAPTFPNLAPGHMNFMGPTDRTVEQMLLEYPQLRGQEPEVIAREWEAYKRQRPHAGQDPRTMHPSLMPGRADAPFPVSPVDQPQSPPWGGSVPRQEAPFPVSPVAPPAPAPTFAPGHAEFVGPVDQPPQSPPWGGSVPRQEAPFPVSTPSEALRVGLLDKAQIGLEAAGAEAGSQLEQAGTGLRRFFKADTPPERPVDKQELPDPGLPVAPDPNVSPPWGGAVERKEAPFDEQGSGLPSVNSLFGIGHENSPDLLDKLGIGAGLMFDDFQNSAKGLPFPQNGFRGKPLLERLFNGSDQDPLQPLNLLKNITRGVTKGVRGAVATATHGAVTIPGDPEELASKEVTGVKPVEETNEGQNDSRTGELGTPTGGPTSQSTIQVGAPGSGGGVSQQTVDNSPRKQAAAVALAESLGNIGRVRTGSHIIAGTSPRPFVDTLGRVELDEQIEDSSMIRGLPELLSKNLSSAQTAQGKIFDSREKIIAGFNKEPRIAESRANLTNLRQALGNLDTKLSASDASAVYSLAKAADEGGRLSDLDVAIFRDRRGWRKYTDWAQEFISGTFPEEKRKQLRTVINKMIRMNSEDMNRAATRFVDQQERVGRFSRGELIGLIGAQEL